MTSSLGCCKSSTVDLIAENKIYFLGLWRPERQMWAGQGWFLPSEGPSGPQLWAPASPLWCSSAGGRLPPTSAPTLCLWVWNPPLLPLIRTQFAGFGTLQKCRMRC